jgi:DNA adenine methylase
MLENCDFSDFLIPNKNQNKFSLANSKARPFVKWVGGKRGILPIIKKYFPMSFNNYYEPFVGGGALFFDLGIPNSFISDLNLELITTYLVIKKDIRDLINLLNKHKSNHSEEYFYKVRNNQFLNSPVEVAARFIYLNKTCYNGLYRVNKNNQFNSPFGRNNNPNIVDEENIELCHLYLQEVSIKYQSYSEIKPSKHDLVYLDPPYHNAFLGYNSNTFDEEKQIELRQFCDNLTANGVMFILSNSNTDFIKQQYESYKMHEILAPRFVNCKADNRKSNTELLILNYEKR